MNRIMANDHTAMYGTVGATSKDPEQYPGGLASEDDFAWRATGETSLVPVMSSSC
jgi:hypothetical protein